ncbi:MAG TPA: hypothetical protein VLA72_03935 [Anaerolineales bacterium]|nr:hypothetical protein [Anaerolineales bacterium]
MSTTEVESLLQDAFNQLETLRNLLDQAFADGYQEKEVVQNITERINSLSGDLDTNYAFNSKED